MSRVPPARSTRHGALENIFITLLELRTRISAVQIGEPTRLLYIELGGWRGDSYHLINWSCEMTRMPKREQTSEIGAAEFKAKCLQLLDEISEHKRDAIIITKRGKPVARLCPID